MNFDSRPPGHTFATAAALAVLAFAGCSRSPYDVAPVSGKVVLDGQPLGAGRVLFAPRATGDAIKGGKAGFGEVEPDGTFVISTYGRKDGAVVAEHAVSVINTKPDTEAGRRLRVRRVTIPGTLSVVAGQDNEFTLELTSEILRTYGIP